MAFSMAFRTPTPLNSIDLQCGHFVENILKPRFCLKPQYCWGPRQAAPGFSTAGRRGALRLCAAPSLAAARSFAQVRICSSLKIMARVSSASSVRSSRPRHMSGSSCSRMPYLRLRARSARTVQLVRIRSSPIRSKAKTRNPSSCVNPVKKYCIFTLLAGFSIIFSPALVGAVMDVPPPTGCKLARIQAPADPAGPTGAPRRKPRTQIPSAAVS
jgi:hypothetical protein